MLKNATLYNHINQIEVIKISCVFVDNCFKEFIYMMGRKLNYILLDMDKAYIHIGRCLVDNPFCPFNNQTLFCLSPTLEKLN